MCSTLAELHLNHLSVSMLCRATNQFVNTVSICMSAAMCINIANTRGALGLLVFFFWLFIYLLMYRPISTWYLAWVSISRIEGLGSNAGWEWYHPITLYPLAASVSEACVCDTGSISHCSPVLRLLHGSAAQTCWKSLQMDKCKKSESVT